MKGFVSIIMFAAITPAHADFTLIQEVEKLRNSISAKDRSRPQLTLRLADLYFDEATKLSTSDDTKANMCRRKAIGLYRESITGADGLYAGTTGSLKTKIEFQLARLHADLGEGEAAKKYWLGLVNQTELLDLRREAALRLGELEDPRADEYFQIAIDLCAASDVCSYAHYRRSWLYKNQGKLGRAIEEIQLALYDAKGQIREESLRDMITFMGGEPASSVVAIEKIDALGSRHNRPDLLESLARSYYASGNREAGTRALDFINRRTPQADHQIQLLEEYYAQRNWDRFHELLEETVTGSGGAFKNAVESEKILRRLAIQLDGERVSQPERAPEFKGAAQLYLSRFPKSVERMKLMEGWTAAETDPAIKVVQLRKWLDDVASPLSAADATRLRELRASIAQKAGNHAVVAEEMAVLAAQLRTQPAQAAKVREYDYLQARALYELKDYGHALPLFKALASTDSPDNWAIQSQNLALDILSMRKDFEGVSRQASLWTQNPALQRNPKLAQDLKEMVEVSEQAGFEGAVAAGQSLSALTAFRKFCEAGKLLPKSCDNARVLAEKLGDEEALIAILKLQGKKAELAAELEAAGYFAESAALLEETELQVAEIAPFLRVATLYELGGNLAHRDRILRKLISLPAVKKSMGDTQTVVLVTLREAGLLGRDTLNLGWSADVRGRIANDLEMAGKGDGETRKILIASGDDLGTAWTNAILEVLQKADQAQAKIKFYGKNSKRKFEDRMAAIQKLAAQADAYLVKSSAASRVRIAALLVRCYVGLASEILASPIPDGLEPEAVQTVKESLAQMAAPFQEKSTAYSKLAREQLARVESPEVRIELERALNGETTDSATSRMAAPARQPLDSQRLTLALGSLHRNPSDIAALKDLKSIYDAAGSLRLGSYFQGRIAELEKRGDIK